MESPVEFTPEMRKEWAAPELKKVDVEEITAAGGYTNGDGGAFSS
jgi:hypothetical protein